MNIDTLIEIYQARIDAIEPEVDEIKEWMVTSIRATPAEETSMMLTLWGRNMAIYSGNMTH